MYYNLKGTTKNFLHIGGPSKPAIHTGTGTPSDLLGIDGDLFISQDENNLYIKRSAAWFNITDSDLITIAGLSHTSGNTIRSNGTNWQSTALSLDDLGDTVITAPANGQVLRYNGTNWVNAAASSVLSLDDLTDVVITTPATNSLLAYDGTNWVDGLPGTIMAQITGGDSDLSEPMLFVVDTTRSNKVLSVESHCFTLSRINASDNDWLQVGPAISSLTGFVMPYDGTVIRSTGFCEDDNGNAKQMVLYINGVSAGNLFVFSGSNTEERITNTNLNINFSAGDKIQVRAGTAGGNIEDTVVNVFVKWRTP